MKVVGNMLDKIMYRLGYVRIADQRSISTYNRKVKELERYYEERKSHEYQRVSSGA